MVLRVTDKITYAGAPVKQMSFTHGWNATPSQVSIVVVNDPAEGDVVDDLAVGQYSQIRLGALAFGGIITSFGDSSSIQGSDIFTIRITDPRQLMNSMPVVLAPLNFSLASQLSGRGINSVIDVYNQFSQDISGENIPGVINISGRNQAGLSADIIQQVIEATPVTMFGNTYRFFLNLPNATRDNRINNNVISIATFINEMAKLGGYDWFITTGVQGESVSDEPALSGPLETGINPGQIDVTINIIDRTRDIQGTNLNTFLSQFRGRVISSQRGFELRNDVSSTVMLGSHIDYLNTHAIDATYADIATDFTFNSRVVQDPATGIVEDVPITIESLQPVEQVIDGLGVISNKSRLQIGAVTIQDTSASEALKYVVDLSFIRDEWPSTYRPDGREMKAALAGFHAWKIWLIAKEGKDKEPWNTVGNIGNQLLGGLSQLNMNFVNPNEGIIRKQDADTPTGEADKANPEIGKTGTVDDGSLNIPDLTLSRQLKKAYDQIKNYADEHYGKTYFYQLPQDTTVVDSAWTFDGPYSGNGDSHINTYFWKSFGKTQAYAQFNASGISPLTVNLEGWNKEDFTWKFDSTTVGASGVTVGVINPDGTNPPSLYTKCTIENGVVKLPQPIFIKPDSHRDIFSQIDFKTNADIVKSKVAESDDGPETDKEDDKAENPDTGKKIPTNTEPKVNLSLEVLAKQMIDEVESYIDTADVLDPVLVFVPSQSRTMRWGHAPLNSTVIEPWFSRAEISGEGQVDIKLESGYNPASFGSYQAMDEAAQLFVDNGGSKQEQIETSSFSIEGIPRLSIGESIGLNANVTNMNVSFGVEGIKTSYNLSTFEKKFATTTKQQEDEFKEPEIQKQTVELDKTNFEPEKIKELGNKRQETNKQDDEKTKSKFKQASLATRKARLMKRHKYTHPTQGYDVYTNTPELRGKKKLREINEDQFEDDPNNTAI